MTTAFSSSDADIIQRTLGVRSVQLGDDESFDDVYEVNACVRWINNNHFKTVALQCPDELLHISTRLVHSLRSKVTACLVILADTSYGSCCVDEVAAEHHNANAVIHYGHSCLSHTKRLPVFYVFGRLPVDLDDCCTKVGDMITDVNAHIMLLYDVVYTHSIDEVGRMLSQHYRNLRVSLLDTSHSCENSQSALVRLGRIFPIDPARHLDDYVMLYIGPENLLLSTSLLQFNRCRFMSYDPETRVSKCDAWSTNKCLGRRYFLVEKARDARTVGIIVGTLGVVDYLTSLQRLKDLLRRSGRKSYTFVVGKINIAKLANFAEIDIFVLIACPENTLLDSSEFYRPVVTPYEMELACTGRSWSGEYETDFRQLLPGGASYSEADVALPEADVSLITGGVRQLNKPADDADSSNALQKRNELLTVATPSAEFYSSRSWRGLDPALGQTPVTDVVEGTKGIAMGYEHEPSNK